MAFSWDWLIAAGLIVGFILGIWARMSGQTIGELLTDIKDFIVDLKDERGDVPYYE
jgi:hypothetical protein